MGKYLLKRLDKGFISCIDKRTFLKCIYLEGLLNKTAIFHIPDRIYSLKGSLEILKKEMLEYLKGIDNKSIAF
ncbi:hypothetical protein [Sphingobacterium endophyticum]|uniref:hypothetical protein n=1 Tax=Sphingobacterium endophyticum TaxID=2546448 RepID=UPI0012E31A31|nr:hypothetical protein [Sphingobacterium endophyticum]